MTLINSFDTNYSILCNIISELESQKDITRTFELSKKGNELAEILLETIENTKRKETQIEIWKK